MPVRKKTYGTEKIERSCLEVWPNPEKQRAYQIEISFSEFTCLCPRSGYPDFATLVIRYVPSRWIVELKSLKLYLNRFRNQPISHEASTNKIYRDLEQKLQPRYIEVVGDFHPRGNVKTVIRVASKRQGHKGQDQEEKVFQIVNGIEQRHAQ